MKSSKGTFPWMFMAALIVWSPALASPTLAQNAKPDVFVRTEVMIPMRDEVRLQTVIFIPKQIKEPLPILLTRTPYGVPENEGVLVDSDDFDDLIADGYIFVFQNLRGRFKSEGQFIMEPVPRDKSEAKSTDQSTDAYDTIDWLVDNVRNNNGKVGIWGISYSGVTTVWALIDPHPALKAASEQATAADMFLGDDFHHNGAFRLSYAFEYAARLETSRNANLSFEFDKYDTYDWYLSLGALSNANGRYFHDKLPAWNEFVDHPNRDEFWKKRATESFLHGTTVPNLNVAGWWDQEDFYGPMKTYELLEKNDKSHLNYIVAGPWNHGGWARSDGDKLGPVQFGSSTSEYFRSNIQAPWFAYWLHGKGTLEEPEALMFQTGSNQWKSYDAWPPHKGITEKKLYFHADRKLSFGPPPGKVEAFDSYVSDPANPVPYRPRPIPPTYSTASDWPVWLLQDQRFADHRPDVLSWQTDVLDRNVVVTGDIVADLFASTSGTDSDWIVKFIDVYPEDYSQEPQMEGYQLIIADEVFRGRYITNFEDPQPLRPNAVNEYKIDLHTNDHVFLKGHRIMVQVQSTWFPLIDRNPQTYVPNIYRAKDSDYRKATQHIYRSGNIASSIILPVAEQ